MADAVPGARAVLTLAVGIHERFKAQRELSDNVAAALDFVAEWKSLDSGCKMR